jgi:hypothetical protein
MTSLQPQGAQDTAYLSKLFNPELTMFGLSSINATSLVKVSPEQAFVAGPAGGPYFSLKSEPFSTSEASETSLGGYVLPRSVLAGASADFGTVIFSSVDQTLASGAAGSRGTLSGAHNLYEWSPANGSLNLVDVTGDGALTSVCGAELGDTTRQVIPQEATGVLGSYWPYGVSADGSKVFFSAPERPTDQPLANRSNSACTAPARVYMRTDGRETVEIGTPRPGAGGNSENYEVRFVGASADGEYVLLTSSNELTTDDHGHAQELYLYNTVTKKLVRVSGGESGNVEGAQVTLTHGATIISEDGSTVYLQTQGKLTANTPPLEVNKSYIYRYDTATGIFHYVAQAQEDNNDHITMFTNYSGNTLVFQAGSTTALGGLDYTGKPDQIYRYSATDDNVSCVSCLPNVASVGQGGSFFSGPFVAISEAMDHPVSSDGRHVFFNSDARLVAQDQTMQESSNAGNATDAYEWEANGTGACTNSTGCVYLISSGAGHESQLLGASVDGSNVFFLTHSALAPQDQDTMGDIYDARVDGGFALPPRSTACSGEDCRLIGAGAPVFGTPQSNAFYGAGDSVPPPPVKPKPVVKKLSRAQELARALKTCRKERGRRRASCDAQARKRFGVGKASKSGTRTNGRGR